MNGEGSDLPLKHWLILPALWAVGAVGGVIVTGVPMLIRGVPAVVNWWLMRADDDVMAWVEMTHDA